MHLERHDSAIWSQPLLTISSSIATPMAQHSNSSGSGNLLVRAFMGILSITATAVVSTMVQRYFATPAPWTPASDSAVPTPSTEPSVSNTFSPDASLLETNQPEINQVEMDQIEINQVEMDQVEVNQPDRSAEVGLSDSSPIQVETQPIPDASYGQTDGAASELPAVPEPSGDATLREKLDSALRDKWNKH
jgi:hypothetical protein